MPTQLDRDTRQDVSDVLVRYASGIDRRDWALFRTCFTEDCVVDFGEHGVWRSADEVTAYMDVAHQPFGHVMHRMTNIAIVPADDGVEARTYVDAVLMDPDNASGRRIVAYYDDRLVSTPTGWKIAHRKMTPVMVQGGITNVGTNVDRSPK